jgi:hypothetical protein
VARIAHELRAGGLAAASADDQTIPPPVADAIIDRLQTAFPKSNARALAQQTLQVFGSINARPPGWPPRWRWAGCTSAASPRRSCSPRR